jgi:hypothetical protein
MKFFNSQHQVYCGVDLHAKTLNMCVVDSQGEKRLHKNFQCQDVDTLLEALSPFRGNPVMGCESTFNRYWLADLMHQENRGSVGNDGASRSTKRRLKQP